MQVPGGKASLRPGTRRLLLFRNSAKAGDVESAACRCWAGAELPAAGVNAFPGRHHSAYVQRHHIAHAADEAKMETGAHC